MYPNPQDTHPRKRVPVEDSEMAYVDTGDGVSTAVFLHGNPTSSYLWRNVIHEVFPVAHCLGPDLIGMGASGPSTSGYRFVDHQRYLDSWFDKVVGDKSVFLIIHDWGSALGFDWAYRHPHQVQGIVYMEAIVRTMSSWDAWPEPAHSIFQAMRSPVGEELILQKNVFIENILPKSVLRTLTDEEMAHYRKPFIEPGESRRPTLTWPREIPVGGVPPDVTEIVDAYSNWLSSNISTPKLFINADPGMILNGTELRFCRTWHNQEEITVPGLHFIQEDSPKEIGQAIAAFIQNHEPSMTFE